MGGRGGRGVRRFWSPACLFTLAYYLPPSPQPPSPPGKGGLKVILCKGLRPLHPRGCTRAALAEPAVQETEGGRGDFGRLMTLPLACFPAPIPPPPFPSGEGGDLRLFYARGSAPCIPGAVPGRHWLSLRCRKPKGGAAILVACLPCHCGTRRGAQGGSRLPAFLL